MTEKQLILTPEGAHEMEQRVRIVRRSIDARQRQLKVLLTVLCDDQGTPVAKDAPIPLYKAPHFQDVHQAAKQVIIVGAGPAGLFAALTLLEHGIKPIVYERGKAVSERKVDIAQLNRNQGLNPESNYCFGEGGAGTFSDGKLFSRSKKRGNMQRVMELFHYFGAPDTVLYEAHAHIGSDKLPGIIKQMRECILAHGGEIHFETQAPYLVPQSVDEPIILAIGHSAHDTYRQMQALGVRLENKGFAMGVRVEHPQTLINRLMYHTVVGADSAQGGTSVPMALRRSSPQKSQIFGDPNNSTQRGTNNVIQYVGNASYSLVTQVDGRGVYSFCMCPGGHIVPAGSTIGICVVNGMSASHRNSPYANSGMVVEIRPEDLDAMYPHSSEADDPLTGLRFQEELEALAFAHGGPQAQAPAQRLKDFVEGRASKDLPKSSYLPGMVNSRLDEWLPAHIGKRLRQGFRDFEKKYHGFVTNEAVILGVESRSSSAVRIPRDPDNLQSVSTPGLYPCGEGAGYAGGITSSALDGINAALKIAETMPS